jgi:hypothetical protein
MEQQLLDPIAAIKENPELEKDKEIIELAAIIRKAIINVRNQTQ